MTLSSRSLRISEDGPRPEAITRRRPGRTIVPSAVVGGGEVPLPANTLSILAWWDVANDGPGAGTVALRVTVDEDKSFLPNVRWLAYDPIKGLERDLLSDETGGNDRSGVTAFGATVAPGGIATGKANAPIVLLTMPGIDQLGPTYPGFWSDHEGAPFDMDVTLVELSDDEMSVVRTIATQKFENFFTLAIPQTAGASFRTTGEVNVEVSST